MLSFRRITLQDKQIIDMKIKPLNIRACEYSFFSVYFWGKIWSSQIAFHNDFMFIKVDDGRQTRFLFPCGDGDVREAVAQLAEYCSCEKIPLCLYSVTDEQKSVLESAAEGRFSFAEKRDYFDYLYRSEDLISLAGKKYHKKRGHLNKFYSDDWQFQKINEGNISDCFHILEKWKMQNEQPFSESLNREIQVLADVLSTFFSLDFFGGILYSHGKPVAFSIGEAQTDDMCVVHFEKALLTADGAYAAVNQQFASEFCKSFAYINREDDAGVPGLRKAKLSYYPAEMVVKYQACYEYPK